MLEIDWRRRPAPYHGPPRLRWLARRRWVRLLDRGSRLPDKAQLVLASRSLIMYRLSIGDSAKENFLLQAHNRQAQERLVERCHVRRVRTPDTVRTSAQSCQPLQKTQYPPNGRLQGNYAASPLPTAMVAINIPCREATYDRSRRIQYQS